MAEKMTAKKKVAAPYDAAEYLATDADIAAYLNAALEDDDPQLLTAALGDVARALGSRNERRGRRDAQAPTVADGRGNSPTRGADGLREWGV